VALLVWPLAAFGGRSASTAIPHAVVCVACAVAFRPRIGGSIDRALLAIVAVIGLQAVSLPAALVGLLSPSASTVRGALAIAPLSPGTFERLSIDVTSTRWALAVVAGAISIFWIARAQFRKGGVRLATRLVAAVGFVVSLLAIAQAATAGRNIYWLFPTEFEGPLPFGPFVNRNHFATWVIMAIPLALGYVVARSGARPDDPAHVNRRSRIARSLDGRTAWLVTSAATMLVGLLLSLSRSGIVAFGTSALLTFVLARRRIDRRHRAVLLISSAIVVFAGLAWADLPALRERAADTQTGIAGRTVIWRETIPVLKDFWLTGTGAGTYQRAMFVYQRSDRTVFFNQAHDHYLQVAAEGGIALAGVVALAIGLFAAAARRRIAHDASGLVWIRIGAACGLGALALQSVWETGLVMPANAALAALLASIVLHEREVHR
jgi:O-antigen ligase